MFILSLKKKKQSAGETGSPQNVKGSLSSIKPKYYDKMNERHSKSEPET